MYTTDSEWAHVMNYKNYHITKIEDKKAKRPFLGFEPATLGSVMHWCA